MYLAITVRVSETDDRRFSAPFGAPENVRILPPISERFVRSRRLRPHSAKTYGNPVHGTACRKTDEFPVPIPAALIGRLMAFPKNG
jgi:hypothetical protein